MLNWMLYSRKLRERIENPKNAGFFKEKEAKARLMRLAIGTAGEIKKGNQVALYLLVDEMDGVIADVKFQLFGDSALIGAADAACELLLRKNYDQARRLSAELIDKYLQDKEGRNAFPKEAAFHLNLVIDATQAAAQKCMDIPISDSYIAPPLSHEMLEGNEYPNWNGLSPDQKLSVIKEVVAKEIQPYIELDAGGVEVLKIENNQVHIAYSGSCTSC
ncbi:MAG TPA: iron-sulfur cluster assembly scaffold protein, partial [Rhabdochlamydiaceae bacterium]|nr:iron-sulfur cluster assembly scaffold protein [Rhabdochlamydiaceae bacterium]